MVANLHSKLVLVFLASYACLAPAMFGAEQKALDGIAVAPPEAVRLLFRSGGFGMAQGATVPVSVVHAASFAEFQSPFALASNTFGTVFGQTGAVSAASGAGPSQSTGRLLPDVPINDWSDDFVDGSAPTSLDGVRVLVNGRESFISFIGRAEALGTSLDQINFISPDDDALGPVSIEVFQGEDMVAATVINRGAVAPGLFAFGAAGTTTFLAAVTADGNFVAPDGFFGTSLESRPARSGETILLFGSGFGATDPPVPAGQIVTIRSDLPAGEVEVTIGGVRADVQFGGLAPNLAGLYQFNVVVPTLPDGNHAVVITRAGVASQAGVSVPVLNE